MRCNGCGHRTSDGARFCEMCGTRLSVGVAVVAGPRRDTPSHLAEEIRAGRRRLEGERKHVTVLFADVKGSMDLAAALDPEEWRRVMVRFFSILRDGV
ncbi:MAG TPA: zinc-ribbon domain-containing protein, partial [Chloroflexota bacterium]